MISFGEKDENISFPMAEFFATEFVENTDNNSIL